MLHPRFQLTLMFIPGHMANGSDMPVCEPELD